MINTKFALCSTGLLISTLGLSQGTSSEKRVLDSTRRNDAWTVGANLGSSDVEDISGNVLSLGVFGDYVLDPSFSVGASLDFWNDSFNTNALRRVDVNDAILGVNGRFIFSEFTQGLKPFVLAGLAVHRFSIDTAQRDPNAEPVVDKFVSFDRKNKDISQELGADLGAGIRYRVQSSTDLAGEVRYRRIFDRTVALDQMNYSVSLSYAM